MTAAIEIKSQLLKAITAIERKSQLLKEDHDKEIVIFHTIYVLKFSRSTAGMRTWCLVIPFSVDADRCLGLSLSPAELTR